MPEIRMSAASADQAPVNNEKATYACLNYKEAYCPREIEDRSVCINSDIDELLDKLA